jgi:phosphatidylglycerol:prolipoprotein diacylglycerol transferase
MFPTLAGLPTYAILQAASVVLFLLLACIYLRPIATPMGAMQSPARSVRAVHALGLTAVYVFCNFVAAKMLFDLRSEPAALDWLNYLRPSHYFAGGYWGWPAVFLPAVLLYPFVLRLDAVTIYRAVSLTLPPVLVVQKSACLAIGCCVGRPTDLAWGLIFADDSQCPTPGVPVHPVPLYDMGIALAAYVVLLVLDRRANWRPFLFPALIVMYGLNRFATEFFRPVYQGDLSARQCLALIAALLALAAIVVPAPWRRLVRASSTGIGT